MVLIILLPECVCCAIVCCGQISENEVCGCPLVVNVFDSSGEFCRVAKRRCNRHHAWEKLRRAEVDMERLRQVTIGLFHLLTHGPHCIYKKAKQIWQNLHIPNAYARWQHTNAGH